MRTRLRRVIVNFNGIDYDMDLAVVRHGLVRRQVDGEFHTMEALADAVGCSRSTVSRWSAGRPTSLPVALAILAKLDLRFDEVYTRCEVDGERRREFPAPCA
jgi:DNA-binding XRE family transcriptional regulator